MGVKKKEDADRVGGNSEYAGLNSITCKHTEGGKAV